MTVNEYAKSLNISVQTVYRKIKRGSLKTNKENGITYVIVDNQTGSESLNRGLNKGLNNDLSELLIIIRDLQKEVKRLTKKLEKCNQTKEDTLLSFIGEMKRLSLPSEGSDIVDVYPGETKKKKKQHNGKKNGKKKK